MIQPVVNEQPENEMDALMTCLSAPQPLSSWSRQRWIPTAKQLGIQPFQNAAKDEQLKPALRVRAIEILTELFNGLDTETVGKLANSLDAEVRARAIWSLGCTDPTGLRIEDRMLFLFDPDPLVLRSGWESLHGLPDGISSPQLAQALVRSLDHESRAVRLASARLVPKSNKPMLQQIEAIVKHHGPRAHIWFDVGTTLHGKSARRPRISEALSVLTAAETDDATKLEAVRLIQMELGDVGPRKGRAAVFDGYAPIRRLDRYERSLDPVRIKLADLYPSDNYVLDMEISRLLAMLTAYNPDFLNKILAKITPTSYPVDDIHHLIVAARIPVQTKFPTARTNRASFGELGH